MARAIGLQGRFDEAQALLNELPDDEDEELRVRILLERGRVMNSAGDPDRALPEFQMASEAAQKEGFEHLAVDAMHMLAIVAAPSEQDGLNSRALELAESATDPRARQWRGSLLNNMGWTRVRPRRSRRCAAAVQGGARGARGTGQAVRDLRRPLVHRAHAARDGPCRRSFGDPAPARRGAPRRRQDRQLRRRRNRRVSYCPRGLLK